MILISVDLATVLDLVQLPHIYQHLYHEFSHRPRHHQEGMDVDRRSTHLGEEEQEAEAADLKAEESAVGVVNKSAEDEAKEIEIKVKMGLK